MIQKWIQAAAALWFYSPALFSVEASSFTGARELAAQIRSGRVSSEWAVSNALRRVAEKNTSLNAVVTLNPGAMDEARSADEKRIQGVFLGPLHGVPILVKDTYSTKGLRTTAGYLPLKNNVPTKDSVVVALLKEAGAIIIGKGNTPTLAMDMQADNPIFGATKNPWNTNRTSGGSSGGDAVAVATGMVALGFGSDLAGSLRIPASYCGIYGLKTSYGIVSKTGHIPPLPGGVNGLHALAVLGPLARSIDDLALALEVIAKPHSNDRSVLPVLPSAKGEVELRKIRVAYAETLGGIPVSADIRMKLNEFMKRLEKAGVVVVKTAPSHLLCESAWEIWGGIVGHQGGYGVWEWARALGSLFSYESVKRIPHQRHITEPISVEKYMHWLTAQERVITDFQNFMEAYDVFICPVSATTAFPHHAPTSHYGDFNIYSCPLSVDGVAVPYYVATQSYTTLFAVTENPVLSMPIGFDENGLPIGVQVVGKRIGDFELLKIASALDPYHDKVDPSKTSL